MKKEEQRLFVGSGRVVDRRTHAGISSLTVEAWGRAAGCLELVDATWTEDGGDFTLEVTEALLTQLFGARPAALFFRIWSGQQLLADTEGSIAWRVREPQSALCIAVDPTQPQHGTATPAGWVVRGRLTQEGGGAFAKVRMAAFDRNVGKTDTLLGEAQTDGAGRYRIAYTPQQLGRAGKPRADLVVVASDSTGQELATCLVCHAPPTAIVDIPLAGAGAHGPSDFERLTNAVAPVLAEVTLSQLSDRDLALVAGSARIDQHEIELLVQAHRLATDTKVSGQVFYGLLRWGLPAERRALLTSSVVLHRQALSWAVEENVIPEMTASAIDAALAELRKLVAAVAFETKTQAAGSLGDLVAGVLPSKTEQQQLFDLYVKHEGPIEAFWQQLQTEPAFSEKKTIAGLQRAFQLGALTRHHLPLARSLEERFGRSELSSMRDLAKLSAAEWRGILHEQVNGIAIGAPASVPGATAAEKIEHYAAVLAWTLETAFQPPRSPAA
jgi:hypothetical protein